MRCAECGESVETFHRHCPHCGTALAQPVRRISTQGGIPIARLEPAPSGPPVSRDMPPLVLRPRAPTQPLRGSSPASRTARAVSPWRVSLLLVVSFVMALALWHVSGASLGPLGEPSQPLPNATACPTEPLSASAQAALTAAQLATRLRDPARQDYRPDDEAHTFTTGQTAYLTFKIATNRAGTAAALFCLPGVRFHGTFAVPAGSLNRYGQFSAIFTPGERGHGQVVLLWDGQVAAIEPFTIKGVAK